MEKIIPSLVELKLPNDFKICFYSDFSSVLLDLSGEIHSHLFNEVISLCKLNLPNFRVHLEIATVPFLVCFFLEEKIVRLATTRLGFESFLLANYPKELTKNDTFSAFSSHVDQITALMIEAGPVEVELFTETADLKDDTEEYDISRFNRENEALQEHVSKLIKKYTSVGDWFFTRWIRSVVFDRPMASFYHDIINSVYLFSGKHSDDEIRNSIIDSANRCVKLLERSKSVSPFYNRFYFRTLIQLSRFVPSSVIASAFRNKFNWIAGSRRIGIVEKLPKISTKMNNLEYSIIIRRDLVVSTQCADEYLREVLDAIYKLSESDVNDGLKGHLTVKFSWLMGHLKPLAFDATYSQVGPRLHKIIWEAKKYNVGICLAGELYAHRDLTLDVIVRLFEDNIDIRDYRFLGITVQAYIKDALQYVDRIKSFAQKYNLLVPVRLVKGENWSTEYHNALKHDLNIPVYINKEETDAEFHQLCATIIECSDLELNIASNNIKEHVFAETYRKSFQGTNAITHEFFGQATLPAIKAMQKLKLRTRILVVHGERYISLRYVLKRLLAFRGAETKILNFTDKTFVDHSLRDHLTRSEYVSGLTEKFFNIPSISYFSKGKRDSLFHEIEKYKDCVIKDVASFSDIEFNKQIASLSEGAKKWSSVAYEVRAAIMAKAAILFLVNRVELSQIVSKESNKNLVESIIEVNEAIDYLNLLARDEVKYHHYFDQSNEVGPVLVITPASYPVSLPVGMIASALVSGCVVAFKSSETDKYCGHKVAELLYLAGVPKSALVHFAGGPEMGEKLSSNNLFSLVSFSGTKRVGLPLQHKVARRLNIDQNHIHNSTAITFNGGNSAAIITRSAHLASVVKSLRKSIFANSGQKCSSTTRLIVDNRVKDDFVELLKGVANDLIIGPSSELATDITPLVSSIRYRKIKGVIEGAIRECEEFNGIVHLDCNNDLNDGHVGPLILELPLNRALNTASFFKEELLGPIVHIVGYDKLDTALELVNSSDFGLACSVFTHSKSERSFLLEHLEVGNIYINQESSTEIIGAIPFGGVKLSGTGQKMGGHTYLNNFHRSIDNISIPHPVEVERGSDYRFYLCCPQSVESNSWREHYTAALHDVIVNFESFFLSRHADKKDLMVKFIDWYQSQYMKWLREGISTSVHIHSYLDLKMNTEFSLVVGYSERPDFRTFLQFLAAVGSGTGVTVLTRNQDSFKWWSRLIGIFHSNGIPVANLDCYFCTQELLVTSLKNKVLSNIIVEGPTDMIQHVLDEVYDLECSEKRMRQVHTPYNAVHLENFYGNFEKFLRVRTVVDGTH